MDREASPGELPQVFVHTWHPRPLPAGLFDAARSAGSFVNTRIYPGLTPPGYLMAPPPAVFVGVLPVGFVSRPLLNGVR